MDRMNKNDLLFELSRHNAELKSMGVRRCGIFGSFARGEARADSDIDILVEFVPEQKTFKHFTQVADFLEALFKRKVDLVTPEGLSPITGHYILDETVYAPLG